MSSHLSMACERNGVAPHASLSMKHSSISLRLFDATDCFVLPGDPRELRLSEAADLLYFPVATHLDSATVSSIRTTLRHWERLTTDPPIGAVTDETFVEFRDALRHDTSQGLQGRSKATVARNLRQLTTIFRMFGPRTDSNKGGKGLLKIIPHCRSFKVGERDWRYVSLEDLDAVFRAASIAVWPRTPDAPLIWRGKFAWLSFYGTNPCDMYAAEWSQITYGDGSKKMPRRDRRYLTFTRDKTEEDKPALTVPIPERLWNVLRPLRSIGSDRIFPCSATNTRDRNKQRDEILDEAGIPPERRFTFADLRPTTNTRLNDIIPGVGEAVLGHAPRGVNSKFYDLWAGRMLDALDRLPVPPAFIDANQRTLF